MDTTEEPPASSSGPGNYFTEDYLDFQRALNAHAAKAGVVFSDTEATNLYLVAERRAQGESEAPQWP